MIEINKGKYKLVKKYYLEKLKPILKELKLRGHITIKIGDEEESQQLNRDYRKKDYPTDVLSFSVNEKFPTGYYIGDIHICYEVALKDAIELKISTEEEFLKLMIHGILHLAGYDHEKDDGEMKQLEDKLYLIALNQDNIN